jgi:putative hydrolase of the HAD superfamily
LTEISSLFWDVGGVILTNGWDREARREATRVFGLDPEDFEDRHELVHTAFENGRITLNEYLDRTVFYEEKPFSREQFSEFMFGRSQMKDGAPEIAAALASTGRYSMYAVNNESSELNRYRIETFGLAGYFSAFFSSCYLGVRKPDEAIYRIALEVTRTRPQESLFIDDREVNVETARRLGMAAVRYRDPGALIRDLHEYGVDVAAPGT